MKQRDHFLDIAKGAAVILVIITHFSWTEEERLRYLFPFWVSMAVPVFMIISGYVGTASYEKKGICTMAQAYDGRILLHKFLRYSVPFLIAYAFDILFYRIVERSLSLHEIVVYFFRGGFGGAGTYYYPLLVQLIFLFPVLYFVIKRYKNGLFLCFLMNVAFEVLSRAYMLNGKCYRLLVFRYIFLIAYGCYLYEYNEKSNHKMWILFFIGAGFIVATNYLGYEPVTVTYWKRTCVYAVLYFLPLFGYAMRHWRNVRCRPLELIGRSSYHIFFVQMLYYNYWDGFIGEWIPDRMIHLFVNIAINICAGIAFSYIETPISEFVMNQAEWTIDKELCKVLS